MILKTGFVAPVLKLGHLFVPARVGSVLTVVGMRGVCDE